MGILLIPQLSTLDPERDAWLAQRKRILGGTDIAKIVGASKFGNKVDVYMDKVNVVNKASSLPMELGNLWESIVGIDLATDFNLHLLKPDLMLHPEYPFLGGSPDFLVVEDPELGVEIKTANHWTLQEREEKHQWGEDGSDKVPLGYLVQSMWYMGISGRKRWLLRVAFYDIGLAEKLLPLGLTAEQLYAACVTEKRTYNLTFDPELFEGLVAEGVEFWNEHIVPQVEPQAEAGMSEEAEQFLLRALSRMGENEFVATPELEQKARELIKAAETRKSAEKIEKELKEELKIALLTRGASKIVGADKTWDFRLQGGGKKYPEDTEAIITDLAHLAGVMPEQLTEIRKAHTGEEEKSHWGQLYTRKPKEDKKAMRAKEAA